MAVLEHNDKNVAYFTIRTYYRDLCHIIKSL